MSHTRTNTRLVELGVLGIVAVLVLAGCGAAGNASTLGAPGAHSAASGSSQSSASSASGGSFAPGAKAGSSGSTGSSTSSSPGGAQYLIKSLQVGMQVQNPRKTGVELQNWITGTDPKATSAGMDVQQVSDNQYSVSMTFTVQASLYPQIQQYLAAFPGTHDGKLLTLHENVQDVTNDYVDTQSRLTNLHSEQQRLLTLMSKATTLGDVLAIEQRLTDVEGQIESIEAHLNQLTGQTTFYSINIELDAPSSVVTPTLGGWNPGQTLHDALLAALAFAEWLATVGIWVVIFSVFVIPPVLIGRYFWRRRQRQERVAAPAA